MSILPETPPPDDQPKTHPHRESPGEALGGATTPQEPGILVVGPRVLPGHGTVQIWADAGSGGTGQRVDVAVDRLRLANIDSGEGVMAVYQLEPFHRRG
ncbi:hypothetical protein O7621_11705 [Solwaraspora sp. WMMD937]|uniref:hypothetical protein n=1 Tax=Micromonosporaceae TaxID=28056 RepID=UPI002499C4C2|nr:hypothetical protein [Solwaraspora sp. WMMD937]WFE23872.1 hypothetical protein O7621_11705 [Solwaraspora sp. WMMD937]